MACSRLGGAVPRLLRRERRYAWQVEGGPFISRRESGTKCAGVEDCHHKTLFSRCLLYAPFFLSGVISGDAGRRPPVRRDDVQGSRGTKKGKVGERSPILMFVRSWKRRHKRGVSRMTTIGTGGPIREGGKERVGPVLIRREVGRKWPRYVAFVSELASHGSTLATIDQAAFRPI